MKDVKSSKTAEETNNNVEDKLKDGVKEYLDKSKQKQTKDKKKEPVEHEGRKAFQTMLFNQYEFSTEQMKQTIGLGMIFANIIMYQYLQIVSRKKQCTF